MSLSKISNKKAWVAVLMVFVATRLVIFGTFWQASLNKGGWQNFYNYAQPAVSVLMRLFHDFCDWHPPLYYALTSTILYVFGNQWFIYIVQLLLALFSLWITYKICRLFFSDGIAFFVVIFSALEPFWAWHNFMLSSENLFTPVILAALFYFFRYFKTHFLENKWQGSGKDIYWSALFFGLAVLVRPNSLFLPLFLSVVLAILYFFRSKLQLNFPGVKKILFYLLIFNVIPFLVILPWMVRNKIVYERFALANILSTNTYFYNLPVLLSVRDGISYDKALASLQEQAQKDLGSNVGDQGNCKLFSNQQLNRQLDYFQGRADKYILKNLPLYAGIHLFKTLPFFFQSGYVDMWSSYAGTVPKPDFTSLILKRNPAAIRNFFSGTNWLYDIVYFGGTAFWGLCSLSLIFSIFYSYFKDRKRFIFFLLSAAIIFYSAFVVSPFVLARYRLCINLLFFIPLAYAIWVLFPKLRNKIDN